MLETILLCAILQVRILVRSRGPAAGRGGAAPGLEEEQRLVVEEE